MVNNNNKPLLIGYLLHNSVQKQLLKYALIYCQDMIKFEDTSAVVWTMCWEIFIVIQLKLHPDISVQL